MSFYCRVCLSEMCKPVQIHCILNTDLQEMFERVTDNKLITQDGRPGTLCYICHAQLRRCQSFSLMSRRAEDIFTDLVSHGLEITHKTLLMLNLAIRKNFTQSTMQCITVDGYSQRKKHQVIVKEEPYENVEINAKTTIEIVNTVQDQDCICKVCLSSNVRMYCIKEIGLEQLFEKVTNIKLNSEDGRPLTICYICRSQLLRCLTFSKLSQRTEKILSDLFTNGFEVTQNTINDFNLKIQNLTMTSTHLMSFEDTSNVSTLVDVTQEEFIIEEDDTLYRGNFPPKSNIIIRGRREAHKCNSCSKKFTCISILEKHIDAFHIPCICDLCNKSLSSKCAVKVHIQTVHAEKKQCVCNFCSKIFHTAHRLQMHIKLSHAGNSFVCPVCYKVFTYKTSMLRHVDTHETLHKKFACSTCDMAFNAKVQLDRHMTVHTGAKLHVCDTCGKEFANKPNLHRHRLIHNGEKPYACTTCDKSFADLSILRRHLKIHSGEKPFACNQCDMRFGVKYSLITHLRTHTRLKPYACTNCARAFTDVNHLNRHIKTHTQNTCGVCSMSFQRKPLLVKHMEWHSGSYEKEGRNERGDDTSHNCNECQKVFVSLLALKRHMKRHSRQKQYACRQCDMRFREKRDLSRHIMIHTDERPYSCDECSKKFRTKFAVKRHIQSHTGEKPYSCDDCGATYADKTYLGKHIVRTHLKKSLIMKSRKKKP